MRREQIEVYSDATNAAIMRHPGRVFLGILIQGDTLSVMFKQVEHLCEQLDRDSDAFYEANNLRNQLWELLNHYKVTLIEHGLKLSFAGWDNATSAASATESVKSSITKFTLYQNVIYIDP